MSYELAISEAKQYVIVRVHGVVTVELARQFARDSNTSAAEHNLTRFLFDVRDAPNADSVIRNYLFAYEDMARLALSKTARSAILTNETDKSHDFVEVVCRNAGYNVRLFADEASAAAWLQEPDSR